MQMIVDENAENRPLGNLNNAAKAGGGLGKSPKKKAPKTIEEM